MTGVGVGGGGRGLVRTVQRRVRLRTRLRQARETWRRAFPRRLPEWTEPRAGEIRTPRPDGHEVVVGSAGALRRHPAGADPGRTGRYLRVVVTDWHAPYPGWSGRLGPLPDLVRQEVSLPDRGRGRATVTVELAAPVPLPRSLAAVRQVLEPSRPVPDGGDPPVSADATSANPRGRDRYGPGMRAGRLRLVAGAGAPRWEITEGPGARVVVAGRVGDPLDERQRTVLAALGAVSLAERPAASLSGRPAASPPGEPEGAPPAEPDPPPPARAQLLAQLAMTGVVLHAPSPPEGLLAPELAALLREPLPDRAADPLEWEVRSVRQRRAAMRHHAAGLARPPSVSALLVTKRPQLVAPAVAALSAQTYPDLEIVVGVHGAEPPPATGGRFPCRVVTVPAGRNLGEALAAATGAAGGSLVTKVDDDDRYGPEHVWDVVLARHYSGATVAGKGAEFVYVEPKDRTVRRRMGAELFTDTVGGGTVTLAREDLAEVGGWPAVPRWVDRALLDRVLAAGGLVYRTHPFGFVYTRHGDGHTWDADLDYFLQDPRRSWEGLPALPELGC